MRDCTVKKPKVSNACQFFEIRVGYRKLQGDMDTNRVIQEQRQREKEGQDCGQHILASKSP